MNILFRKFDTPFESIPFSKIKPADYSPALESEIASAKAKIEQIAQSEATPDFENTLVALEDAGRRVNRVASLFFNLHAAVGKPEMQRLAEQLTPMLTEFQSDISLHEGLFKRIKAVCRQRENLNPEQQELLRKTYLQFSRNGAELNPADKRTLRNRPRNRTAQPGIRRASAATNRGSHP